MVGENVTFLNRKQIKGGLWARFTPQRGLLVLIMPKTKCQTIFVQLGFNEADTLKSSSILIYSHSERGIYTQ